ncbi:MAG: hypothetical protein ACKO2P_18250 [Planctomycetota bacterium]
MTWFCESAETDGTGMAGGGPVELLDATEAILSGCRLKNKHGSEGSGGIPDLPDLLLPQSSHIPHFLRPQAVLLDFSNEFCEK